MRRIAVRVGNKKKPFATTAVCNQTSRLGILTPGKNVMTNIVQKIFIGLISQLRYKADRQQYPCH